MENTETKVGPFFFPSLEDGNIETQVKDAIGVSEEADTKIQQAVKKAILVERKKKMTSKANVMSEVSKICDTPQEVMYAGYIVARIFQIMDNPLEMLMHAMSCEHCSGEDHDHDHSKD